MENGQFMRFLAAWALVHEAADEGWKASVVRGVAQEPGQMGEGPEAFVDGLSALVAEEKERLKAELAAGATTSAVSHASVLARLDELMFEIGEVRGRVESLQASVDALVESDAETRRT